MKLIDILRKELIGKNVTHLNRYNRKVTLKVEDIVFERHSIELEAATPANDWWPATSESVKFLIKFEDGSSLDVDFSQELLIN